MFSAWLEGGVQRHIGVRLLLTIASTRLPWFSCDAKRQVNTQHCASHNIHPTHPRLGIALIVAISIRLDDKCIHNIYAIMS